MRQAGDQADPDPVSPSPRRRWGRRLALLLTPLLLAPLGLGVWGWFHPTNAWLLAQSALIGSVVGFVNARDQIPKRARPHWIAMAIGYMVLVVVAGLVGAWLAP